MRTDHTGEIRRALVNVADVCSSLGIEKSKTDRGKWTCPQHGGGSLSVRVKGDTIQVRCFGGCDLAGDVFSLIAAARGLDVHRDFPEVLLEGARIGGLWPLVDELEGKGVHERRPAPPPRPPPPPPEPAIDSALYSEIAQHFVDSCGRMPRDVAHYLEERGVLGYAQALGCFGLPPVAEQGAIVAAMLQRFSREDLEAACILRRGWESSLWWSGHRLGLTWRRTDGSIAMLQRRLVREATARESKYVSPGGVFVRLEPFGAHAFAEAASTMHDADLVIVEGALDVAARMTFAMRAEERVLVIGAYNVTSEDEHDWRAFVAGRRVRVALDVDEAGERAAPELARVLLEQGARDVVRERPLDGADWGEALARRRAA